MDYLALSDLQETSIYIYYY